MGNFSNQRGLTNDKPSGKCRTIGGRGRKGERLVVLLIVKGRKDNG